MQSERSPTGDPGCIASVPLSVSTVTPRRCAPVPPRPSLSVSIYTCLHLSGSYLYLSVSLFIPYTVCLCSHPRQLLSLPLPCVLCLHLCPDERPGHAPPLPTPASGPTKVTARHTWRLWKSRLRKGIPISLYLWAPLAV